LNVQNRRKRFADSGGAELADLRRRDRWIGFSNDYVRMGSAPPGEDDKFGIGKLRELGN